MFVKSVSEGNGNRSVRLNCYRRWFASKDFEHFTKISYKKNKDDK